MAIGERIRFIRNLRGMTQKYLGIAAGFDEKTADIRMAQYESGTRTPKADMTNTIAGVLDVSPLALSVPDIDSEQGLLHTLFALEDLYGIKVQRIDDEIRLCLDKNKPTTNETVFKMLSAWAEQAEKYNNGETTKDQYDKWRYNYPKFDDTQDFVKIQSKELSDVMVDAFKNKLKDM
ncbi:MAG: helix-turn-helix transcriptional regulator [Clostridiales bacterium]|nr:helix-turn-helix transcriptional regulator [Clostridiales bacterium]